MGQGLNVKIDDSSNKCLCKVDIKPWVFSKRNVCKSLVAYFCKIDRCVLCDLSSARFRVGLEPFEVFFFV